MSEAVFVGREREVAQLQTLLERVLHGQGQMCFVTGEAGSGKTALVAEFARRAQLENPALLVAIGTCNAQTGLGDPYLPFREILGLLVGDVEAKLAQQAISEENANRLRGFLVHSGEILVEVAPDLVGALVPGSKLIAVLGKAVAQKLGWTEALEGLLHRKQEPPTGAQTAIDQDHIFEQYTKALQALAARQPLVVVVDDLQWIDSASVGLLFHLGREIARSRILLVGCYRPADLALGRAGDRHPLASVVNELTRYYGDITVDLDQAAQREVREFVEALLDAELNALGEAFREALSEHTGGHPLFTIELLRDLEERGDLQQDEAGRWVVGQSLDWSALPVRVESVIEERFDRLDAELQQALTVASVEGVDFTAEVVASVQGKEPRELVRRLSGEAEKKHRLVYDAGLRRIESQRLSMYRFRHALFQTYLYNRLDEAERAYLHEDVGTALEALYGESAEQIALQLSRHFEQAQIADKALHYLFQAGEQASALHAPLEAVQICGRGLHLAERLLVAAPTSLLRLRGEAYQTLGAFKEARSDYEAALDRANSTGDSELQWQLLLDLGQLWAARDYARAGEYFQRALTAAELLGDSATIAHSLNRIGNWQVNIGQPDQALRYHHEALKVFQRLQDRHGLAETYDLLGMASYLSGDMIQSNGYYEQAVELFRELNDLRGLASSQSAFMTNADYLSETIVPDRMGKARCLTAANEALEMARELRWRSGEAYILFGLGLCLGPQGEYTAALEAAQEGLRIAEDIEHYQWMAGAHVALGALYLDLMSHEQAREHLEQAQILAEKVGSQFWLLSSGAFLASTYILQQDLEGAEVALNAVLRPDTPQHAVGQRLAWCVRGELALAAGDPTLALQTADQLLQTAANLRPGQAIPRLFRLRGQALAVMGRTTEAEVDLRAALEEAHRRGAPGMEWRIRAALGELCRTTGRAQDADVEISAAMPLIEELAARVPDGALRQTFVSRATLALQAGTVTSQG